MRAAPRSGTRNSWAGVSEESLSGASLKMCRRDLIGNQAVAVAVSGECWGAMCLTVCMESGTVRGKSQGSIKLLSIAGRVQRGEPSCAYHIQRFAL